MFKKAAFLSATCISIFSYSQSSAREKLGNYLDSLYAHKKVMGSFAFADKNQASFLKVVGFSDVGKQQKANMNTQYRIGSVSKTFTAVIVMKAVEEKKLKLNQKLSDFYPQVVNANQITIQNLLQHRSGIHNITAEQEFLEYYTKPQTNEQMISRIEKLKSDFSPGTKYEYSNSNYILLGLILEKIYKATYADLVQTKISKPLNLNLTHVGKTIDTSKNQAKSFQFSGIYFPVPEGDMTVPIGAGNIISTPTELLKFITNLENGKLISKQSLSLMKTFVDNYGFGLVKYQDGQLSGYGHEGMIDGFHSALYYFPDEKVGVSFVTNHSENVDGNILDNMIKVATGKDFVMPDFNKKSSPEVSVNVGILKKYEGLYKADGFPLDIKIFVDGNILYGQATGQGAFPLKAVSETEFHFEMAGIEMKFDASKKTMNFSQKANKVTFTKQ